jgi:hypothetical protein
MAKRKNRRLAAADPALCRHRKRKKIASRPLSAGEEMDAAGLQPLSRKPTFFRRTTVGVCQAVATPSSPEASAVLKRHAVRTGNRRLRQAFLSAVNLSALAPPCRDRSSRMSKRAALWDGLRHA